MKLHAWRVMGFLQGFPMKHRGFTTSCMYPVSYVKFVSLQARLNLKSSEGCQNQDADPINLEHVTVGNGVVVQVETIPLSVFERVDFFYCCVTCGKVFWEGKHFEQVCSQFSHVIKTNQPKEDAIKGSYASQQQC